MKKIQDAGFRIVEVPVHHYHRAYGKSQFFNFRRIFRTGVDVMRLWCALVVRREHRRRGRPRAATDAVSRASRRDRDRDYATFYRGRRVMITGGLGFIGSNLARQLVDLGADVLLVDSLIPDYGGNLFNIDGIEDRVRVNIADVRQESTMNYLVRDRDGHLQPGRPGQPHRQHAGSRTRISRSTAAASCRSSRRAASTTRA